MNTYARYFYQIRSWLPLFLVALTLMVPAVSKAGYLLASAPKETSYLMAEADGDDTYDPFADYSEFDEASDEEADIHFFHNGRFFTIGIVAGLRAFTDQLPSLYSSGATYGIFLSYFFDLNLALQFGFLTGDYDFNLAFQNPTDGKTYTNTGSVSLTFINMDLKYYFNTQNVTKGLADLNPYLIGGISQVYRTYSISGIDGYSREATVGLNGGAGIEIPLMRRKAYLGLQAVYHMIPFKDKNTALIGVDTAGNQVQTSAKPRGDTYDFLGILGLNF